MATLAYPFEVRDSANTTTNNLKTGLAPTASNGKTMAASPATVLASTLTIVEVTGGHYIALYDAEANGDASFPVDNGSALTNVNDRYITLDLTRDSGRLINSLPVPAPAATGGLPVVASDGGVIVHAVNDKTGYALATPPPNLAAIEAGVASAILVTPGQPIATDSSGNVSVVGGGGNTVDLGSGTVTGTPTLTLIALTSGNLSTTSGEYNGRRLYFDTSTTVPFLLTQPCSQHTYAAGVHTFSFAVANNATPAVGDVAKVGGP